MNYLSHLFFSQRTPESFTGNLMGDFKPSSELRESLPLEVIRGIENHRFVDRVTDAYQPVKDLRSAFSPERRRFAGVISDIAFDYFLIKHWDDFAEADLAPFTQQCYSGLSQCHHFMPPRMLYVVENMNKHDWLNSYATIEGIGITINQVSKRIRFDNNLSGGVQEVIDNYVQIEDVFLSLFAHLKTQVAEAAIEG